MIICTKKIGQLQLKGPFSGKFAGARQPQLLRSLPGRSFLVATNEGERFLFKQQGDLHQFARRRPAHEQPAHDRHLRSHRSPPRAEFPYPEVPENYPWPNFNTAGMDGAQGPFGPHNIHEPMSNKLWLDQNPKLACCRYSTRACGCMTCPTPTTSRAGLFHPQPERLFLRHPGAGPCWLPPRTAWWTTAATSTWIPGTTACISCA